MLRRGPSADTTSASRPACPRCGSTRLEPYTIGYADGPVPAQICLECGYVDLQQLPTYIPPDLTTKLDDRRRRLPNGEVLGISRQAGVIDAEGTTVATTIPIPEHT